MSRPFETRIVARDTIDFAEQIAAFAFASFIAKGVGAVMVKPGSRTYGEDGEIRADVVYASHKEEYAMLPSAAILYVERYDAAELVVLVFLHEDGTSTCSPFDHGTCLSPVEAYTKLRERQADIDPGDAVRLKRRIGDIRPGLFIFLRQEKQMMKLVRVRQDEPGGEIVETDEEVDVHMDYQHWFKPAPMPLLKDEEVYWLADRN